MVLVGGRSMVLPKLWERIGSVHEGLRESVGRGRVTSTYSWGGGVDLRRWRRCLVKWDWWAGGDEAEEEAESGRIKVSRRRRREGFILVGKEWEEDHRRERRDL